MFRDITVHSLGVLSYDLESGREYNRIVIPEDSEVPVQKSLLYTTVENNQTGVRITLLEQEDKDPQYCTVIGEKDGCVFSGIPPMLRGAAQIEVTIGYDK